MADNFDFTAGTGKVGASDDCAGVHYPKVKLVDGTIDSTTIIATDVGAKVNALRVAPANDITDATYIGDIKFGEALPAGTAAIGKLAANSGVDIGDVDVTSVPAPLNVVGTGTEATALRVTIATDSTGVVSVDDNGGTLTVDGTVTANLGATDNAVLDAIAAVLDIINAKLVTGTVIGDVNLGATDNAVLDSIVTNTTRAAIDGYGQAKLDSANVTTAQVLIAAVAAKKFYLTSITLSVAAAGSYWIEDDDAAQITCKFTLAANGGLVWSAPIDTPFKSTTANKGLKVKGSAAGVVGCMITYYTLA